MKAFVLRFAPTLFLFLLITPSAQARLQVKAPKEWTVLVYMNAHNNLDDYGDIDLNEMESVGSSPQVNVIVQWASLKRKNLGVTPRLLIKKDNDPERVTSPTLMTIPLADMGSAETLKDFLFWGIKSFPAKRYFVIVWNHGMGWHGLTRDFNLDGDFQINEISHDEITDHSISTPELGRAILEASKLLGRPIDLYGSDACSMASIEVAGEMLGAVNYFMGSEELEPGEGWAYHEFLGPLVQNPTSDPVTLSSWVADSFIKANLNDPMGVTLSTFDMNYMEALFQTLKPLVQSLSSLPRRGREMASAAADMSQHFWFNKDYHDLGDFLAKLRVLEDEEVPELMTHLNAASEALSKVVVVNRTTPNYFNATGMTVWLPPNWLGYKKYDEYFKTLKFEQVTGWSKLVEATIFE